MDIKIKIIEQFRQVQMALQRSALRESPSHSTYRGQGLVLSVLKQFPEISRKDLGNKVDISRQSLTELLGKMEESGYITRTPMESDRRNLVIRLTEAGHAAAQESSVGTYSLVNLLECLSEEELLTFSDYLERILLHKRTLNPSYCGGCGGPESCTHSYLKYGHKRPNPKFCKYAHLFPPLHIYPVAQLQNLKETFHTFIQV